MSALTAPEVLARNPGEVDLSRNEAQESFVFDDRRFLVWIGGRGSSKTSSTCLHLMRLMSDPHWYGARWLFTAPIYAQIKKGPLITFDEWFDPRGMIVEKINGNEPERRCINGWTVIFRNASKPEGWRGLEIAGGSLDEAGQLETRTPFNLMNASMRQKRPDGTAYNYQTTITTTPRGKNWLYKDFVNPSTRLYDDDKLGVYLTTTQQAIQSGFLEADYIENSGYTEGTEAYRQEMLGEFVGWAGNVFDYDEVRCTPDPLLHAQIPPPFVAVYGGIDIGTSDPTAIVLVGKDVRGRVWVFKEFYQKRADFDMWIDLVGQWTREFHVKRWYVDSDITERMMRSAGFTVKQPYKAKDSAAVSINYINSLIKREMFYITPDCYALRSEMENYHYKEHLDGDESTILAKISPGQADHAIDALRYAVLPLSGASGGIRQRFVTGKYG